MMSNQEQWGLVGLLLFSYWLRATDCAH